MCVRQRREDARGGNDRERLREAEWCFLFSFPTVTVDKNKRKLFLVIFFPPLFHLFFFLFKERKERAERESPAVTFFPCIFLAASTSSFFFSFFLARASSSASCHSEKRERKRRKRTRCRLHLLLLCRLRRRGKETTPRLLPLFPRAGSRPPDQSPPLLPLPRPSMTGP